MRVATRMANIRARHLSTKRDRDIKTELTLLVANATVRTKGDTAGGCLALIGGTGAGKSCSIAKAIAACPEFLPRVTGMTETAPILTILAPRPSDLLQIAYEGLEKLGYPLERDLKPPAAWKLLRRQLRARQVRFLHIDEAQHMLNVGDPDSMKELSDALKMLLEDRDWPVSLILTGMPELADFLSIYRQIQRRSRKIILHELRYPQDEELMSWIVSTIVTKHAKLKINFEWGGNFLARLHHAANRQFGTLTQIVRASIERALVENPEAVTVTKAHFIQAYALFSGCAPEQNIISARDWEAIEPLNALLREEEEAYTRLLQTLADREKELRARRRRRRKKDEN
ncbi:ATP-binding protein [Aureimonas sp. AU22]|uniref:ATP-binding protein n=1 Tax=Aureimonas sp. AU22 TaxID=1638162 RepID=UPI001AEBEBA5|nr:ATP-binding protein [Aureimonas sp. AU22]